MKIYHTFDYASKKIQVTAYHAAYLDADDLGLSYTIPDYYQSDINLRHFPVLSGLRTFHTCSFCLILLYYHNFMCEIHFEIPKFDVAPIVIRYRVTGVLTRLSLAILSQEYGHFLLRIFPREAIKPRPVLFGTGTTMSTLLGYTSHYGPKMSAQLHSIMPRQHGRFLLRFSPFKRCEGVLGVYYLRMLLSDYIKRESKKIIAHSHFYIAQKKTRSDATSCMDAKLSRHDFEIFCN